jgi:outer membrane protein W
LAVFAAGAASAQDQRVEIGANVGWVQSDGVTFDGLAVNGNIFNSIEPKDGMSLGLDLGFFATENVQVQFAFTRQDSKLVAGGSREMEISDLNVDNYMGNIVYHFGESSGTVRPYVFGGLGMTHYGNLSFQNRDIDGESKFATNWGAGVKLYPSPRFGLKLGVKWTPTYIKSDAAGYWCDPYWGCYTIGDAQYSNQFEFGGGLSVRF